MPFLVKATKAIGDRMPKVISPTAHAIIDYGVAAGFLGSGAALWNRNRPAAISAFIAGGAELMLASMTDYPGGIVRKVSFETHGRIDVGLALLSATLPEYMNFADQPQSRLFTLMAAGMAAVTGLTDFTGTGETKQLKKLRAA